LVAINIVYYKTNELGFSENQKPNLWKFIMRLSVRAGDQGFLRGNHTESMSKSISHLPSTARHPTLLLLKTTGVRA
jgi:hypothetical protein